MSSWQATTVQSYYGLPSGVEIIPEVKISLVNKIRKCPILEIIKS